MARANGHDVQTQVEAEQTSAEQQAGLNIASQDAAQSGFDPAELQSEEFLDSSTDLGLDRDLPDDDDSQHNLADFLAAESSKQYQIGNISREEWRYQRDMDQAKFAAAKCQFASPGGVGAKCTGRTRARMTGGQCGDHKQLTPDLNQQLQSGYEAISMSKSKSINGFFLKRLLESFAVTRSEGYDVEGDSGGLLSKLTGGLLG